MTRAHFVQSARKDNPVAKRGESYYWWKFRYGGKRYSKTKPKQSQLTQSEFWSAVYSLQESLIEPDDMDACEASIEEAKGELENLRDETQSKLENMPQGLQDGDTGQLLQERIDALEEAINTLESVDTGFDEPEEDADADGAEADRAHEVWNEVTEAIDSISCS